MNEDNDQTNATLAIIALCIHHHAERCRCVHLDLHLYIQKDLPALQISVRESLINPNAMHYKLYDITST